MTDFNPWGTAKSKDWPRQTAVVYLGLEAEKPGDEAHPVVVTTVEWEGMEPEKKLDDLGHWIQRLRELYCYVREEHDNGRDWNEYVEEITH